MKKKVVFLIVLCMVILAMGTFLFYLYEKPERADVVIIGAGGSGMTAAIEADAMGKDVILLEKMPMVGGNSLRATAGLNGVLTEAQARKGIEDSYECFYQDTMEAGHYLNDERLVEIFVYRSTETLEWLQDLGVDLSDVGRLAGHSEDRTHRPEGGQPVGEHVVEVLYNQVREQEIDLRLENKAVDIIIDEQGRVTGVVVQNREGREYVIHSDAVIIATGGFGGSPELFVYYNEKLKGFNTTNNPGATGDFIDLVDDLDVALVDMSFIQTHPTVVPDYGVLITEALRGNGGILINNSGKRFTDEMKNRDLLSQDMLQQDKKEVYLIFNENIRNSLAAIEDYVDMKLVIAADDIETLADSIAVDQRQLNDTMAHYNTYVKDGEDLAFGREDLYMPLDESPYYAIRVQPGVHYCMGGIKINEKTQVINNQNRPIEGLYASGECTGGLHGENRLGGNSLIDAVTFGRIAGQEASQFSEEK